MLLASVGVYNAWFLSFGTQTAGDWGYFVKAASDTLRRHYFSVWLSDTQFGRVLIDAGQAPTYAAYGWLSYYLNASYAVSERLVHLWPSVLLAIISSYLLVQYIFKDKFAAALGAIVYSANTYYLALLTGGLTLSAAYALAPLVLLFYMKAINNRKVVDSLACALLLAICGAYEPRVAYIVVFAMLLLAGIHYFFVWQPKNKRLLSRKTFGMVLVYGAPLVVFGLLNAYWILGLMHAGGGSDQAISSSLFGNEFFTLSEALTIFHPYWTGGQIQPFFIHPIPLYFWLIPIAAITGLVVSKRSPVVLFFAIIGVIGIVLTKQSDQPFAGLYQWLFTHAPGFNAFREASKFYLLTALAYAVLLPAVYWYVKTRYKRKWLTIGCFTILALLFLPNLIPIATNAIGGTFDKRSMPKQYVALNKFLDTSDYGRILWVPQKSRWGYASANHPAVSATALLGTWKSLAGSYPSNGNATSTDEINALLQQNYMPALLADASVRYVVVPLRDTQNNDNFYRNYNDDPAMFAETLATLGYLKEANVHIQGFAIYQTVVSPKPYFSSATQLYSLTGDTQLPADYTFWKQSLAGNNSDFNFTFQDASTNTYATGITDLFGGLTATSLHGGTLPLANGTTKKGTRYYFDQKYADVSYTAGPHSLSFQTTGLPAPGVISGQKNITTTIPLNATADYVIATGSSITPVVRTMTPMYLGSPRSNVNLYTVTSANLVPKPTIDDSLWQKYPDNCAPYGNSDSSIRMVSSQDDLLNRPVLALSADDHAACSGPPKIAVQAGETYMLHMRYRGYNAQYAGYKLTYDTADNQAITNDIPVADNVWHTYQTLVTIPSGATHVQIQLIARPSNQMKDVTATFYTDLSLEHVHAVATLSTATGNAQLSNATVSAIQTTPYKGYSYKNLIPNGSFEQGLWQKKVSDCDAYDSNPALGMSLVNHISSSGKYALQLKAARHIACTNTKSIPVQSGATYLLQFDYQSPNAQYAGYAVSFDDGDSTRLSQQLPIADGMWHTYSHVITVPTQAHNLTLAVFAYSNENSSAYLINRYDDFALQRVPDIANRFYAVSTPGAVLAAPQSIQYQTLSSTYKKVTVTGADKPFLLVMSEQYHPDWQLVMGNAADSRKANYVPWSAQPESPSQDHIQINAFENAWYIDPQAVCKNYAFACKQEANGTYVLHFGVQFSGQRWFNLGMVISGITACLCVSALIFLIIKQRYDSSLRGGDRP
ncbi:MAG TPA: hypothetical protein VLG92_03540 [Candidatus Saccharimonadia bacterium]|nr:hypothetical protein [Candidatus Saccharimonadia bacterium]